MHFHFTTGLSKSGVQDNYHQFRPYNFSPGNIFQILTWLTGCAINATGELSMKWIHRIYSDIPNARLVFQPVVSITGKILREAGVREVRLQGRRDYKSGKILFNVAHNVSTRTPALNAIVECQIKKYTFCEKSQ